MVGTKVPSSCWRTVEATNSREASDMAADMDQGRNRDPQDGRAPQDVRDETLGDRARPYEVYQRGGMPGEGPVVESPPQQAPHAHREGWSTAGMAIPALLIGALIIALGALAF